MNLQTFSYLGAAQTTTADATTAHPFVFGYGVYRPGAERGVNFTGCCCGGKPLVLCAGLRLECYFLNILILVYTFFVLVSDI